MDRYAPSFRENIVNTMRRRRRADLHGVSYRQFKCFREVEEPPHGRSLLDGFFQKRRKIRKKETKKKTPVIIII